jgi:hypothetical protein
MRHPQAFTSLFALLLMVSSALAQAGNLELADQSTDQVDIAAARSRYLQSDDYLSGGPSAGEARSPVRHPRPVRPPASRAGYPQGGYSAMWGGGNPRHATIGALIGFGLGAAIGAKVNSDNHGRIGVRTAILFGSFGALIGAVAGSSFEPMHYRSAYRRRSLTEGKVESRSRADHAEHTATANPADSLPLGRPPVSGRPVSEVSEVP